MSVVEFLTSKEIIVVYVIAAVACLLCFIIYLVEKNNEKARRRHNTKELNKLVEAVQDEVEIEEKIEVEKTPEIIEVHEKVEEPTKKIEVVEEEIEVEETPEIIEVHEKIEEPTKKIEVVEEEIEYIEKEPTIEEVKEELHKVILELEKEQTLEETQNIELTNYEQEQEENAIISLEELVKKGKEIYENNELREYSDDGNEPISLHELEERVGKTATNITDTFIIENVVPEEELIVEEPVIINTTEVSMDMPKVEVTYEKEKGFIPSPIISPIYGITKEVSPSELELENTADYEKLDAEIKKTNEFLMTLKELQKNLD